MALSDHEPIWNHDHHDHITIMYTEKAEEPTIYVMMISWYGHIRKTRTNRVKLICE